MDLQQALRVPYEGKLDPNRRPFWTRQVVPVLNVFSSEHVIQVMDGSEQAHPWVSRSMFPRFVPRRSRHIVMSGPSAFGPGPELNVLLPAAKAIVSPQAIGDHGAAINKIAQDLVRRLSSPFDLARLTDNMTYNVMCLLLGIDDPEVLSEEYRLRFFGWIDKFGATPPLLLKRNDELTEFFQNYMKVRRARNLDMPVDALLRSPDLKEHEKSAMLFFMFLSGTQTSSYAIAMTMALLQTELSGAEYARFREAALGPDGRHVLPTAYFEGIRSHGPAIGRPHRVLGPRWFAGRPVLPGCMVNVCWTSANRDPELVGDDSNRFDPYRKPVGLGFGRQPRLCPGKSLSTRVSTALLRELLKLNPKIRSAQIDKGEFLRIRTMMAD